MSLKKVNKDPFSNGTDCGWWMQRNCSRCYKAPKEVISDLIAYTQCRCSIYRDIETRMFSDEPIAQRTIRITANDDCPFRQEHWKSYPRKRKSKTEGLPSLFD